MGINRRGFLAAGAGSVAALGIGREADAAQSNTASVPRSKDDLPTPALVLDLDAFEFNLKKMADHCRAAGCGFRPHAKTHKCPEIARRQIASGAAGVCVATVPEAEAMVAAGIQGVLLTSPIVEVSKLARMVQLARTRGQVMLSVSHPREVDLLRQVAEAAELRIDVLVDVDVGDRRTGILPGEPALGLARLIESCKSLRLRGVQAYAGSASHTVGYAKREQLSREVMAKAVETRNLFLKSGLNAEILSGGSTGTYNIDSGIAGVTELQVGSYAVMDVDYRRIGGKDNDKVYSDFKPALTVLTTVVSATHAELVTVDAGVKAFSSSPDPAAKDWPGLTYKRSGDEFGSITAAAGAALPKLCDRLEFIVPHCDPTVSLYDQIYACRGDKVEAIWPIAGGRDYARKPAQ